MWTCPKCGEAIDDQFDSCWKCARELSPNSRNEPKRLTLSNLIITAIIAYCIPWIGVVVQSGIVWWRAAILAHGITTDLLLSMLIPGAITFAILLPFLKNPRWGRRVAVLLVFGWIWVACSFTANVK